MRIGDLARRTQLRTSALRYYESIGLLPAAARISGRREYDGNALNTLQLIQAAQRAGFTLAETRSLLALLRGGPQSVRAWQAAARTKLAELDTTIARLESARDTLADAIDCACGGKAEACKLVASATPTPRSAKRSHTTRARKPPRSGKPPPRNETLHESRKRSASL